MTDQTACRAAFEKWAEDSGVGRTNWDASRHCYEGWQTQQRWQAWQAAWNTRAPEGEIVVTKDESGRIVAVTRQDVDGRVLRVIDESEPDSDAYCVLFCPRCGESLDGDAVAFASEMEVRGTDPMFVVSRSKLIDEDGDKYIALYTHPPTPLVYVETLKALVEELRVLAVSQSAKANDKNWSEWMRDRARGEASGIRIAADELQAAIDAAIKRGESDNG